MASQLKLQVLLAAVDKITRPLKSIQKAAGTAAKDVSNTQRHIKELNKSAGQIDGYRKVSRSLGTTSAELGKAQTEAQRLGRQLAQTQNPTKGMTREFQRAQAQVKKLQLQQTSLTNTQRNHRSILKSSGIDTRNLSTHQRGLTKQLGQANRALEQQKTKLKNVALQQKQLAQARQKYDSTKQLQGQIAGQGAKYAAGGAAALYGASRVIAPGIAYGEQMSELQAVSRLDKDDDRYKALAQQSRDYGASTAFSATDVGAGQTFLARAGFSPEAIHASMKDVLDMALANGTDLAQTADIASNIGGVFKLDPEIEGNMTRIADVLSGVSARANVDLGMLGDAMKYLGAGSGLGLSLEEAAAMAGMLGNIGIQGSQAGTTMRAMINRLTGPAAAGAKAMKGLGLEVADAEGNMRKMPDIIKDVANATKEMGNVERAAIFKDIFGTEAGSGIAELVAQQGDDALYKLTDELMKNVQGDNAAMAATRADNLGGDLKGLSSAWEEIGISIAMANDGPIRGLVTTVTDLLRSVGKWINDNPKLAATLSKIFGVIAGLAVVGGTLALAIAGLLGPFAAINFAMATFGITSGIALGPVLLVIAAVVALGAAAYLIYKNWDQVSAYFGGLWGEIKEGFSGGIAGIAATILNFSPLGLFYRAFAGVMNYFGIELPETFTGFGSMIISGIISGIMGGLGAVKDKIVGAGKAVAGWFKDTLGIKSPSKVFTQFGDDTMQGLANGLANNHDPEQQVTGMAKKLKAAGAGLTLGIAAMPAAAGLPDTTDAIAQVQAQQQAQASQSATAAAPAQSAAPIAQDYSINIAAGAIVIHAAPGMDEQAIAQQVARGIESYQRQQAARNRGRLDDLE